MSEVALLLLGAAIGVASSIIGIVVKSWINHRFKIKELKVKARLEAEARQKERAGDLAEKESREKLRGGKVAETVYGKRSKYEIIKRSGAFTSKYYVRKDGEVTSGIFSSLKAAVEWAEKAEEDEGNGSIAQPE